ncbi:MAG: hypothetical protein HY914_01495 [Desulfomonile tiedjei]|nr:hypothetical protein [Desulfomonile tiedjei]
MIDTPNQIPLKLLSWRASMTIRPLTWILLGPVLVLLLLGNAFGAAWENPPPGQPNQMQSRVDYDPKLTDPFFTSNEWSYPWYIIKHGDGHFEDTTSDKRPDKEPPHLKHTAKCFSTSYGSKHLVRFCAARFLGENMIDLFIHEKNPAFRDALRVRIRNGMFTSQYWTRYVAGPIDLIWTTKRQKLTLDKKEYRKGDVIKGRIDFECVQEITDPEYVEEHGRGLTTIKVNGVFKTIVE